MKSSTLKSFRKKLSCPSSNLLLSFSTRTLAPEINFLIKHHLAACDFCYCEIPLLAFYTSPLRNETRAPELPINLRLLAESVLSQNRLARKVRGVDGEKGYSLIELESEQ